MPNDYIDKQDEVINVMLPKQDYNVLRDMIDKQKSLNWVGKWFRGFLFVTAGGLLTLLALGDQIKAALHKLTGS